MKEETLNKKIRRRTADIKRDPSIGKSEEELRNYLRKRGVIRAEKPKAL